MTIEHPSQFIFKLFLRHSGPAGSAETDMNTDSDVTPSTFRYTVPIGRSVLVQRINFQMVDDSMGAVDFGGIASGLSNGITIKVHNAEGGVMLDFLDGTTIKRNTDFCLLAGSDIVITELSGKDQLPVRWTVARAGAILRLISNQYIEIVVNDDLSGLDIFRAMLQGVYE
jgi:hypothetical protein